MNEIKKLFQEAIAYWFQYMVIVGKITIKLFQVLNNRTVVIGAVMQIEVWLAELRQELLSSKKKPLTIIGKKFKDLTKSLEKIAKGLEGDFKEPEELVEISKQLDEEFFDPRKYFESKSEARKLVESSISWSDFTRVQWNTVCSSIAEDYPSLVNAAQAAKAKYPKVETES